MRILTIKNKKDEAYLRTPVSPLDFAKENMKELRELVREMRRVMLAAPGVGLSANQVGVSKRLFVAQVPDSKGRSKFYAILNPVLTKISKEVSTLQEGCLSIPGVFGEMTRPAKITLEGLNPFGKKIKLKAVGLLARVFQHELDHLDGVLFIDKATGIHRVVPDEPNTNS